MLSQCRFLNVTLQEFKKWARTLKKAAEGLIVRVWAWRVRGRRFMACRDLQAGHLSIPTKSGFGNSVFVPWVESEV